MLKEWFSHRYIAKVLGIGITTVHRVRNGYENNMYEFNWPSEDDEQEDIQPLKEETTDVELENKQHTIRYEWGKIVTKEEFFEHIGFNPEEDEVISYQRNIRPVILRTSKDSTMLVNKYEHFLRTRPATISASTIEDSVRAALWGVEVEYYRDRNNNRKPNGRAAEICIFDAHINKKTAYWEAWNTDVATEVYRWVVNDMIDDIEMVWWCDTVCLVVGNDFFNSDAWSRTTWGTLQDNNDNEYDAFAAWLRIIINAIESIRLRLGWVHIHIVTVPWNHSIMLETILGTTIATIYWELLKDWAMSFDCTNAVRKYWNYGVSTVLFAHWDDAKRDTYPMVFANERPDLWAASSYREVHLWHVHHQIVDEINGVVIRYLSSVTTSDRWHERHNYVNCIRWWQMFIWDDQKGNKAQFNYYIN